MTKEQINQSVKEQLLAICPEFDFTSETPDELFPNLRSGDIDTLEFYQEVINSIHEKCAIASFVIGLDTNKAYPGDRLPHCNLTIINFDGDLDTNNMASIQEICRNQEADEFTWLSDTLIIAFGF